jgi:hypothetical protein
MATSHQIEPLKSGLDADSQFVIGESGDEFAALQYEYIARFQPRTPEERFHVDSLIRNEWMLRRLFRAEAHLWEYHVIRADRSEGTPLGAALMAADQVFRRLQRRITLAERSYKEAFAELERLQRARTPLATHQDGPQPQPDTADTPELGSFLTSVGPRHARPTRAAADDQPHTLLADQMLGFVVLAHVFEQLLLRRQIPFQVGVDRPRKRA